MITVIRIMALEKFCRSLRVEIGNRRQRGLQDDAAIQMQRLLGEIEETLRRAKSHAQALRR